jgi:hypothetical protein
LAWYENAICSDVLVSSPFPAGCASSRQSRVPAKHVPALHSSISQHSVLCLHFVPASPHSAKMIGCSTHVFPFDFFCMLDSLPEKLKKIHNTSQCIPSNFDTFCKTEVSPGCSSTHMLLRLIPQQSISNRVSFGLDKSKSSLEYGCRAASKLEQVITCQGSWHDRTMCTSVAFANSSFTALSVGEACVSWASTYCTHIWHVLLTVCVTS